MGQFMPTQIISLKNFSLFITVIDKTYFRVKIEPCIEINMCLHDLIAKVLYCKISVK